MQEHNEDPLSDLELPPQLWQDDDPGSGANVWAGHWIQSDASSCPVKLI